jgi:hypothetical protein
MTAAIFWMMLIGLVPNSNFPLPMPDLYYEAEAGIRLNRVFEAHVSIRTDSWWPSVTSPYSAEGDAKIGFSISVEGLTVGMDRHYIFPWSGVAPGLGYYQQFRDDIYVKLSGGGS